MFSNRMLTPEEENKTQEVDVRKEDQERINAFSMYNSRADALEEHLKGKKDEKESVDDAMMELELADEDQLIPYQLRTSFVHLPASRVLELLQDRQNALDAEIDDMQSKQDDAKDKMGELKAVLSERFGAAINLDR